MEARITLTDDVAEHAPPPDASERDVVQDMVRNGIVTHKIDNAQALDAVFAVSQIRDLPEVSFVAAFDDGLILLGCPDGLPDSLTELVEPVGAPPPPAQPDLSAKLDALAQRMDEMHKTSEDRIDTGLSRIETLSHRLEFVADALHPDNVAPAAAPPDFDADFAALRTLLEGMHEKIGNQPRQDYGPHFDRLEHSLSTVSERNANQSGAIEATLTQLGAGLNALIDKVDDAGSKEPDLGIDLEDALSPLAAQMTTVDEKLAQFDKDLKQLTAVGQQQDPGIAELASVVAALQTKIQDLANSDAADRLDGLKGEIAGLKTLLGDSIPQVSQNIETMQARVTTLTDVAQRLDDMDPKRGFERIEAGLSAITQHVDATLRGVQDVSSRIENSEMLDQITGLASKVDTILERPAADSSADDLIARFNAVAGGLDAVPDRVTADAVAQMSKVFDTAVAGLHQDVKRLAHQPTPVIDLTEQRRGFANFTAVMSALTTKLEATAEQIARQSVKHEQEAALKTVLARLETLPEQLSAALPPAADFSSLETRLDDLRQVTTASEVNTAALHERIDGLGHAAKAEIEALKATQDSVLEHVSRDAVAPVDLTPVVAQLEHLTTQAASVPDAVDALRTEIAGFVQRPAAPLDLTAQRESFARFGTAMGAVVSRLEDAIAHLDARAERADADTSDLQAVVQALPVALHQALDDAQNNDVLQEAIAGVRGDLAQVAETVAAVEELRSLIDMLARRPDPTPDMSEQRRGFARFGTAMATVVQRLEHVSSQLDENAAVELDFDPITASLDGIRRDLDAMADAQTQQASALQTQLAELSADLENHPSDSGAEADADPVPAGHVSLEEMRFLFAELVASQMRDNAARAKNS